MAGPGDPAGDLARAVEAALFAATEPMTPEAIAVHLAGASVDGEEVGGPEVGRALAALAEHYRGRGIELVERGRRWHFQTAADLAHLLRREREEPRRLSRAATEVLAIVAYHEPVSRAEIESIRGVQTARGTLDVLIEAGWVRAAGRRDVPGRPMIYATTPGFLAHFGLQSRRDLPGIDELRAAGLLEPVEEAFAHALEEGALEGGTLPDPAGRAAAAQESALRLGRDEADALSATRETRNTQENTLD